MAPVLQHCWYFSISDLSQTHSLLTESLFFSSLIVPGMKDTAVHIHCMILVDQQMSGEVFRLVMFGQCCCAAAGEQM